MKEVVNIKNDDIINCTLNHEKQILDMSIKNGSYENVMKDENIKNLLTLYKKKKYHIFIYISGAYDPKKVMENIVTYKFKELLINTH